MFVSYGVALLILLNLVWCAVEHVGYALGCLVRDVADAALVFRSCGCNVAYDGGILLSPGLVTGRRVPCALPGFPPSLCIMRGKMFQGYTSK